MAYQPLQQAQACQADVEWLQQLWRRRPAANTELRQAFARSFHALLGRYLATMMRAALLARIESIVDDLWTAQSPRQGMVVGRHGQARSFELAPLHASMKGLLARDAARIETAGLDELLATCEALFGPLAEPAGLDAPAGNASSHGAATTLRQRLARLDDCGGCANPPEECGDAALRRIHHDVASAVAMLYERCNVKEAVRMNWFAALPPLDQAPRDPNP